MYVFLDSADRARVDYWVDCGVIDGVTTNPLVMKREGVRNDRKTIVGLAEAIAPRPLHVEATVAGGDELVVQARRIAALADNVVVKIPVITPAGEPCLRAIAELQHGGVRVNVTACFSYGQAVLGAKTGAEFVSVFMGRIDDEGGDGAGVVARARRWIDRWGLSTKLVAASLRGAADVQRGWDAGADCVTVPPSILDKLVDHKNGRSTVDEFLQAVPVIGSFQD
jgi:transaldolase